MAEPELPTHRVSPHPGAQDGQDGGADELLDNHAAFFGAPTRRAPVFRGQISNTAVLILYFFVFFAK